MLLSFSPFRSPGASPGPSMPSHLSLLKISFLGNVPQATSVFFWFGQTNPAATPIFHHAPEPLHAGPLRYCPTSSRQKQKKKLPSAPPPPAVSPNLAEPAQQDPSTQAPVPQHRGKCHGSDQGGHRGKIALHNGITPNLFQKNVETEDPEKKKHKKNGPSTKNKISSLKAKNPNPKK